MKRLSVYIRLSWQNILRHKGYSFFVVFGAAISFAFITVLMQIYYTVDFDRPPFSEAGRIVEMGTFHDYEGKTVPSLRDSEMPDFAGRFYDMESYAMLSSQISNIYIGDVLHPLSLYFTNPGFWDVFDFRFIDGRPFNASDVGNGSRVAVIEKKLAQDLFGSPDVVGRGMEYLGSTFTIIGVVDSFTEFSSDGNGLGNIWIPNIFNEKLSNGSPSDLYLLFSRDIGADEIRNEVSSCVTSYFNERDTRVDIRPESVRTLHDRRDDGWFFSWGIWGILFILILVPSVNIVSLSAANAYSRLHETSVCRALGATSSSAFTSLMTEHSILVFIGVIIGILLVYPLAAALNAALDAGAFGTALFSGLDVPVIVMFVLPVFVLFSLLSGGLPAWRISRKNIADSLKGNVEL